MKSVFITNKTFNDIEEFVRKNYIKLFSKIKCFLIGKRERNLNKKKISNVVNLKERDKK